MDLAGSRDIFSNSLAGASVQKFTDEMEQHMRGFLAELLMKILACILFEYSDILDPKVAFLLLCQVCGIWSYLESPLLSNIFAPALYQD